MTQTRQQTKGKDARSANKGKRCLVCKQKETKCQSTTIKASHYPSRLTEPKKRENNNPRRVTKNKVSPNKHSK